MDYYFFGVGVSSLVAAFFLLFINADFYYFLTFFYALNFSISFLLNLALNKKIKEIYVWNANSYIMSHLVMAVISAAATVSALIFIKETMIFISYFMSLNFIIMSAILLAIFVRSQYFREKYEEFKEKLYYNLR